MVDGELENREWDECVHSVVQESGGLAISIWDGAGPGRFGGCITV
jgi:hypothetical protein